MYVLNFFPFCNVQCPMFFLTQERTKYHSVNKADGIWVQYLQSSLEFSTIQLYHTFPKRSIYGIHSFFWVLICLIFIISKATAFFWEVNYVNKSFCAYGSICINSGHPARQEKRRKGIFYDLPGINLDQKFRRPV